MLERALAAEGALGLAPVWRLTMQLRTQIDE
jgi:hypothetical protein